MLDGPGPLPVFTERNVPAMGEVLGAALQVFVGRAEETAPMDSWGRGPSPTHPYCGDIGHEPRLSSDRPGSALTHH